jgi:hypothetical protein
MKTMTRYIKTEFHILAAISILGFASLEANAANLLLNGSFETSTYVAPIPGGYAFGPYSPMLGSSSISNWSWSETVAPYPGAVRLLDQAIDGSGAIGGLAASVGTYAVSLEGNASSISQTITLAAGQYQLSFDASWWLPSALAVNPIYASLGGVNFSFNNSTNAFSPTQGYNTYTSGVFTLATAGAYELRIAADNPVAGANAGTAVDNVSLTAVPEPSSLALVGLGAVALLRRRRAQA